MDKENKTKRKGPRNPGDNADGTECQKKSSQYNERYFCSLIENSSDAILVVSREGTLSYESPSVQNITGYTPEERQGRSIFDLVHPDDVSAMGNRFSQMINKQIDNTHLELRIRHKNGSWRFVEVVGRNLLDDDTVAGIMVNLRDITARKQAEEELRIKENALENSINALAMSDMEGKITYVNRACMRLWGEGDKEELLGKPYWVLLKPDDMTIMRDIAKSMIESHSWEGKVVGRKKDGKEITVQVASSLVKDDRGNPIQTISSFVDITERLKAERALRESESKFRSFVEEMNDCYCVLQGSKVVFTNARGAEMFGYTSEEVIGKSIQELLPSEVVKELEEVHLKRRRGERIPPYYETTLMGKKGTSRPVEFGARVIEYSGKRAISLVARDISNRKQMEQALRESEARFRAIFEGAAISIALVGIGGKPLAINPALEQMLGYSMEEFITLKSSDYLHPEDAMMDANVFMEMVSGIRENYRVEKRYIHRNGGIVWAKQTLSLVRDSEGKPKFFIAMIEDVTERRTAEEERQRLEQQLQLAGRLAAVGELAAGVAHELNNPLTAVQAFAQLLTSREDLDKTVKKDLETIYREAQRATKITGNLLSFARRHKPEKQLISINEIIERSLELHAYRLKLSNIETLTEMSADLPMIMADPHQMQQVFVNIIANAEQAITETHDGGKLWVNSQMVNGMIQVTFTDDGPGILQENLESIFDPFFTTKDVGRGTGLGLSICYGIVEEHGGYIYARNNPGEGATFVVEIPILSEDLCTVVRDDLIQVQKA